MADYCSECGAKLVDGKCLRPGCLNYAKQPEDKRNVKMEPVQSGRAGDTYGSDGNRASGANPLEPVIPGEKPSGFDGPSVINMGPARYDIPGDDLEAPVNDDPQDGTGASGYVEPGIEGEQKSGLSTDDFQKKLSDAGKKADEAIKGGFDKLGQSFERQRAKERAIMNGTGRGFTGKGDETITGIKLVKDEKMVRTYHCTTYGYFKKKEGYMTVTNKRVIFESMDETSRISNEVALDGVSGFRNYFGMNVNPAIMACAVICIIGAIWMYQTSMKMHYGGGTLAFYSLLLFVMAGVCGFLAVRKSVVVNVFSSKSTGTPISVGEGPKSMIGNGSVYTMVGRPTEDTGTMIREIGAMVQDLQTRGDHAIEDWVIEDSANPVEAGQS